jgi:hypothetical protein
MIRKLWRNLTIEWPAHLYDWLWFLLVIRPAEFLNGLLIKHIIWTAGMLVLIVGFTQTFPIELAFIFAGDTMLYFEVVTSVMYFAAQARMRIAADAVKDATRRGLSRLSRAFARYLAAGRQRRNASALRRNRSSNDPPTSEDEPGLAWSGSLSLSYAA